MQIAVISKVYASIVRKDACKESVTKVMEAVMCRINMPSFTYHLLNHRLFSKKEICLAEIYKAFGLLICCASQGAV